METRMPNIKDFVNNTRRTNFAFAAKIKNEHHRQQFLNLTELALKEFVEYLENPNDFS